MPGAHFNREGWPVDGPHLDMLEVLRVVHTGNGLRSLRVIGRDMNLAYTQVHKIVRGAVLPVDERQVRDLVHAVAGRQDEEVAAHADSAVGHWRAAVAAEPPAPAAPVGTGPTPQPVPAPPVPRDPHSERPVRRTRRILVAAAAVVVLVAGALAVVGTWSSWGPATDNGTDVASGQILLADDFGTGEIDPLVWNRPERPDVVTVREGALHFTVDPEDTADGLHTQFAPRVNGSFAEVSFVAGVPGYDQSGPGGIALIVTEAGGRNHRLLVGPSSGGPEAAALFCDKEFCSEFDDYVAPSVYVPFEVGESVPIRLVASGGRLNFYVRDRLVEQSPPVGNPLTSLVFDVYGVDGEAWNITVDTLMVTN